MCRYTPEKGTVNFRWWEARFSFFTFFQTQDKAVWKRLFFIGLSFLLSSLIFRAMLDRPAKVIIIELGAVFAARKCLFLSYASLTAELHSSCSVEREHSRPKQCMRDGRTLFFASLCKPTTPTWSLGFKLFALFPLPAFNILFSWVSPMTFLPPLATFRLRVIPCKYIFLAFLKWQGLLPSSHFATSVSQWRLPVEVCSFLSKSSLVLLLDVDGPHYPDMFFLWYQVTLSSLNLELGCVY